MTCETVIIDGVAAIVCDGRRRKRQRCECGSGATLLCDWKLAGGKTCDRPICAEHAEEVAPDKHLCREHQTAFAEWRAKREAHGEKSAGA